MAFLLCGQTDSGKSTISGNLLLKVRYFQSLQNPDDCKLYRTHLENAVNPECAVKSKYSILMDLIDGEITTNKTKTSDFNLISFQFDDFKYTLIDTPGHKLYIRSLVSSLSQIPLDCIVLVISSIHREFIESFERGTVKEDLLLTRSTGCTNLLILYNKADVCTASVEDKNLLYEYCKKLNFKQIRDLDVSGFTGLNLDQILPIVKEYTSNQSFKIAEECKEMKSEILKVQSLFFTNELLTVGYSCVMHLNDREYEITIEKIQGKEFRIPNGTQIYIKIKSDTPIYFKPEQRVIFRSHSNTLGFGVIKI